MLTIDVGGVTQTSDGKLKYVNVYGISIQIYN